MKTMRLLSVFCIAVFIIVGCEKDPTEPPVNPPATLTFDVQASDDTIQKGGLVNFNWISNADSCILLLSSGEKYKLEANGSKSFLLNQNTSFEFKFFLRGVPGVKGIMITVAEDPLPNPPVLTLIFNPIVPFNRPDTIVWTTTDASSLSINGISFPVNGSLILDSLRQDTILHFFVSGPGGSATENAEISVGNPTNKDFYCAFNPWKLGRAEYQFLSGGPWYQSYIIPGSNSDLGLETFYYDHSWTFTVNGELIGNGSWNEIPPDSLLLCGGHYFVQKLDQDSMILVFKTWYIDSTGVRDIIQRDYYYHP